MEGYFEVDSCVVVFYTKLISHSEVLKHEQVESIIMCEIDDLVIQVAKK